VVISYWQTVRHFSRDVRLFLFAVALMGFTFDGGIFAVIFNLYLLRLGYGPEFVGLVNSAGTLAFALSALPTGALGERLGSRNLLLWGIGVMCAGSLMVVCGEAIPTSWQAPWLVASYAILHIGLAAFFVNSVPYLLALTTSDEQTAAFAVQSALISLAAFAGSLTGGLLPGYFAITFQTTLDEPLPYRYPLLFAGLLLLTGIGAIRLTRPDEQRNTASQVVVEGNLAAPRQSVWGVIALLSLVRLLLVSGSAVAMTFFNVYLDDGLAVPPAQIGLAIALGRLSAVPAALLTPLLAARWGNAPVTVAASLGIALFLLPLALTPAWYAAGLGYVGVIALTSVRYPAFMIYSMALVPARYRATLAGAGEMAAGLSFAALAFVGGYLIEGYGYPTLFLTGMGLNVLGALLLIGLISARVGPPKS
jgi:MFS family permease